MVAKQLFSATPTLFPRCLFHSRFCSENLNVFFLTFSYNADELASRLVLINWLRPMECQPVLKNMQVWSRDEALRNDLEYLIDFKQFKEQEKFCKDRWRKSIKICTKDKKEQIKILKKRFENVKKFLVFINYLSSM